MKRANWLVTAATLVLCCLAWPAQAQQDPPAAADKPIETNPDFQSDGAAPPITEQPVDKFTPFSGGEEVSKDFPISFPTDI